MNTNNIDYSFLMLSLGIGFLMKKTEDYYP